MPLTLGMLAASGAKKPLDCLYGENKTTTSNLATYNFTLAIGPADPDRVVVVCIGTVISTGTVPIPTVTVGGVTAELIDKIDNTTYSTMMFAAKVPTGTTASVVAAFGTTSMRGCYVATWAIYGGAELQPKDKTKSTTASGYALDSYKGGCTIQYVFSAGTTSGWTNGLIEDFDYRTALGQDQAGAHIENAADATQRSYSVVNSNVRGTVLGAWAP